MFEDFYLLMSDILGSFQTPHPPLKSDIINGRSLMLFWIHLFWGMLPSKIDETDFRHSTIVFNNDYLLDFINFCLKWSVIDPMMNRLRTLGTAIGLFLSVFYHGWLSANLVPVTKHSPLLSVKMIHTRNPISQIEIQMYSFIPLQIF